MSWALLMPAAGSGVRLSADRPKALLELAGIPLFVHAIRPFLELATCAEVILAAPRESIEEFRERIKRYLSQSPVRMVAGGATRQESVANALAVVATEPDILLIHDAARPLICRELIERVLNGLTDDVMAVMPGIPLADTVKRIESARQRVVGTVARNELVAAQTPQLIRRDIAEQAHRLARESQFVGTDDVSLVERFALGAIRWVEGDPSNIKVTTPEDFERARLLLEER